MVRRAIIDDDELAKGAKAIAADLRVGETRRLKLAKIINDHLVWFDRARSRGLEWTDIVDLLFKAGVTRPDGRPLSRGHLSSLVWRKMQSSNALPQSMDAVPDRPADPHDAGQKRRPSVAMRRPSEGVKESNAAASAALNLESAQQNKAKPHDADGKSSDRDKLFAFMRRSAQVRRSE